MLAITPQMRILVAVEAVDFRKGIDSLAELCRVKLNADPFSGCVFVFRSKPATSIKVLVYDGQGFWLAAKRLSKGFSFNRARRKHAVLSRWNASRQTDPKVLSNSPSQLGLPVVGSEEIAHPAQVVH